jgi:putative ABC transport system ATP-binding protein
MISIRDLRKTYQPERVVLRGIDLEIEEGSFVSIVGRSGSGKTTLLNVIRGLDTRYEGEVEVAGVVLRQLRDAALSDMRGTTFGHVFQAYHLLEHLTVRENASLPWIFCRGARIQTSQEARRRADEVLEQVGLGGRSEDRPGELSGGERQRLALARALYVDPRVLLCDEPTGNLDPATGSDVVRLLRRVHSEGQLTIVVATHDDYVSGPADVRLRLSDGVMVNAT